MSHSKAAADRDEARTHGRTFRPTEDRQENFQLSDAELEQIDYRNQARVIVQNLEQWQLDVLWSLVMQELKLRHRKP